MDSKLCYLLLVFSNLQTGLTSSTYEISSGADIVFTSQPKDSDVCIGSSAEMHCSFYGTDTLPMWSINSANYTSLRLPPNHKYNGRILTVDNVYIAQNGTTYQCFFDLYSLNGTFYQLRSNIGRLNILTSDACVQHMGPTNISRQEGEQNVFIPCPLSGLVLPVWKINGYFYELYQIPKQYAPAYGGIYVKIASRELNGTVFQCYTKIGYGFISEASSIGILTVQFASIKQELRSSTSDSCINPDPIYTSVAQKVHIENNFLYLDHQNMFFDEHNITLTWMSTNVDCSTFKIMFRKDCGYKDELQPDESTFTVSVPNFTFPIADVEGKPKIDIYIESVNNQGILCQTMKETIKIYKPANFSKMVPSSLEIMEIRFIDTIHSTFYVVLPQGDKSLNQQDCFCPVVFHEQETCYHLDTCSCISGTIFNNSYIEICYQMGEAVHLVIKNLTSEMNNTLVHVFYGFYCDTYFIPPYRIYAHQFQIFMVLPESPKVEIDENNATICFYSNQFDGISLDRFEITIYDRTGQPFIVYNIMNEAVNAKKCIKAGDNVLRNEICAPFLVSTSAINSYGKSTTNLTVHTVTNASDTCSCLKLNVEVNMTVIKTYYIEVRCPKLEYESSLTIEIRANELTAAMMICSRDSLEEEVYLQDLDCSKQYNLSAVWVFNNSNYYEECSLFERNAVSFDCPALRNMLLIILVTSISGCVCLILTIFGIICSLKKMHCQNLICMKNRYQQVPSNTCQ